MDRNPHELSDTEFQTLIAEYRRLQSEISRLEAEGKRAPRPVKGLPATDIQDLKDLEL